MLKRAFLMLAVALPCLAMGPKLNKFTLSWTPSPSPTVSGYWLYYGTTSGVYTGQVAVGTNTTTFDLRTLPLPPAVYFLTMTATNDTSESGPANEISWDSRFPSPPGQIKVQ